MKKIIIALLFISSFSSFAFLSKSKLQQVWNSQKNDHISIDQIDFNQESVNITSCIRLNTECSGVFYIKNVGTFEIHVNKENGSLFITNHTAPQTKGGRYMQLEGY